MHTSSKYIRSDAWPTQSNPINLLCQLLLTNHRVRPLDWSSGKSLTPGNLPAAPMYKCAASHTAKHFSIGGGRECLMPFCWICRACGNRNSEHGQRTDPFPHRATFLAIPFRLLISDVPMITVACRKKKKWEWRREHLVTQRRMFILARFESRKTIPTMQCNATDDTLQARSV